MKTHARYFSSLLLSAVLLAPSLAVAQQAPASRDKATYVHAVTRGAGLMPWQNPGPSPEETAFRAEVESRKDALLQGRVEVSHPVMIGGESLERARRNVENAEWAKSWLDSQRALAEHTAAQGPGYIEVMIPDLTPTNPYGMTCPNCVGRLSQEGVGQSLFAWSRNEPEIVRCRKCGQTYPDEKFPEAATLECPRMGQTFTYYLNEAEQANPDDRSGKLAWRWVDHPIHVSFSGVVRQNKIGYMFGALSSLAYAYAFDGNPKYAETAAAILDRLAHCYRNWLYHDYWDAIADCDPMYAAYHDRDLPIEWKRHLVEEVYAKDTLDKARMEQNYWGAGRYHPSTDGISQLVTVCQAYDLVYNAADAEGRPLWTPERRVRVERDLILEYLMGAEPYLGGPGRADTVNNKSPRLYHAMAAVAKCLGIRSFGDTAHAGFIGLRDQSFLYDGFSKESPAYTNMYLSQLTGLTETLHGLETSAGRLDLYGSDERLRLMLRAVADQLAPDGTYIPTSDTNVGSRPGDEIVEVGMKRYPEYFAGKYEAITGRRTPSTYAIFELEAGDFTQQSPLELPEILFPAWGSAILRHSGDSNAAMLNLVFSPPGGHRHGDNLNVYYVSGGHTILGDLGYVGDMPVNAWIRSTHSHNLVIVDDKEQWHFDPPREPRLEMMVTAPEVSAVEASSNVYPQCGEYRRLVALIKEPSGTTFAIDIFRVAGGSKHVYRIFSELAASDAASGALELHSGLNAPPEPPLPSAGQSLAREDIYGLRDVRRMDNPPPSWTATWRQADRSYRLWMLSQVDRVEAGNGPGQTTRDNAGRRVRVVDAVREGENLRSVFAAIHEPSVDADLILENTRLLPLPESAGANAVAIRFTTRFGEYLILNEFDAETALDPLQLGNVSNVRFQGKFAALCEPHTIENAGGWRLSLGASTLTLERQGQNQQGFTGLTPEWRGGVTRQDGGALEANVPRPPEWPALPDKVTPYALMHDGAHWTGFAIRAMDEKHVQLDRFAPPSPNEFSIPRVTYDR